MQHTLRDLFEKATHPERVFVGVVWQYVTALPKNDGGGKVRASSCHVSAAQLSLTAYSLQLHRRESCESNAYGLTGATENRAIERDKSREISGRRETARERSLSAEIPTDPTRNLFISLYLSHSHSLPHPTRW